MASAMTVIVATMAGIAIACQRNATK